MSRTSPTNTASTTQRILEIFTNRGFKSGNIFECDGLKILIADFGRPILLTMPDEAGEELVFHLLPNSIGKMDEYMMKVAEQLDVGQQEELYARILQHVQTVEKEIQTRLPEISEEDLGLLLRTEKLMPQKERMLNKILEARKANPALTLHDIAANLFNLNEEQIFSFLELDFDYARTIAASANPLQVKYLQSLKEQDSSISFPAKFAEIENLEEAKLLALHLGFSKHAIEEIDAQYLLHLRYFHELKNRDENHSPEEMVRFMTETREFIHASQFDGLLLGLNPERAVHLVEEDGIQSPHLNYLTDLKVGNNYMTNERLREIFDSIIGLENTAQFVAKEIGFSDAVIAQIKDGNIYDLELIRRYKQKNPETSPQELTDRFRRLVQLSNEKFEAVKFGISLEVVEQSFLPAIHLAHLSYLRNLQIKNPALTDTQITEKFLEIENLVPRQLQALGVGLPLEIVQSHFALRTEEPHLIHLMRLRKDKPKMSDEEITSHFLSIKNLSEKQLEFLELGLSLDFVKRSCNDEKYDKYFNPIRNFAEKNPDIGAQELEREFRSISSLTDEMQIRALNLGLSLEHATKFVTCPQSSQRLEYLEAIQRKNDFIPPETMDYLFEQIQEFNKLQFDALEAGLYIKNAALCTEENAEKFAEFQKLIKSSPEEFSNPEIRNAKFCEILGLQPASIVSSLEASSAVAPTNKRRR